MEDFFGNKMKANKVITFAVLYLGKLKLSKSTQTPPSYLIKIKTTTTIKQNQVFYLFFKGKIEREREQKIIRKGPCY